MQSDRENPAPGASSPFRIISQNLEIPHELLSVAIAVLWVPGQRLRHNPLELVRNIRTGSGYRSRVPSGNGVQNRCNVPAEGLLSSEHFVKHCSQRPDIRAAIDTSSQDLFG